MNDLEKARQRVLEAARAFCDLAKSQLLPADLARVEEVQSRSNASIEVVVNITIGEVIAAAVDHDDPDVWCDLEPPHGEPTTRMQ